jgi:hypothetical protein
MNISNISSDGDVRNIGSRRTTVSQSANTSVRKDTLSLSGDVASIDRNALPYEVEPDYPPRQDRIEEVELRVEAGAYSGEFQESVAGSVLDSGALNSVLIEATASYATETKTDQIDTVRAQAENGFYDSPAILRTIADSMLSEIDFTDLLR